VESTKENNPQSLAVVVTKDGENMYNVTMKVNQEQAKYMMEVGLRTLISLGAITCPEFAKIPSDQEKDELAEVGETYKKTLN
jgi:hypothetical protein